MSHFVLVHGGGNGPWKWELLEPELQARGHTTLAVDMPVDQDVGLDVYIDAVCDQMAAGLNGDEEDIVLVGHSLAGAVIPHVANRHAVQALVYLAAAVPGDYDGTGDADAGPPAGLREGEPNSFTFDDQGRGVLTEEAAYGRSYHDCSPEVAASFIARRRPQSQSFRKNIPTLEKWPEARTFYIACEDDRTTAKGKAERAAKVLGVEPLQLPGGHSPMVSRPGALAELLHLIAQASAHYRR